MKTLTKFLFIVACISLLFSCQKPDEFSDELSGNELKSAASCGVTIVVNPSGNDDTQALKDAFEEAKASGPGATVKLTKGKYTIGPVEVRDYDGYFRGAGKGKTIISNLPNLPCEDFLAIDNVIYLIQFVGGNITISDLTFHINDGSPCTNAPIYESFFGNTLCTVLVMADFSSTYVPVNRQIKGVVKNVDFIAGKINGGINVFGLEGNVNMSLYCGVPTWYGTGTEPLDIGEITVRDCGFYQNNCGPDFAAFGKNSIINIENNVMEGNTYGMFMWSNLGAKFTVKNNKFKDEVFYGLWIEDNDWGYYPSAVLQNRTEWNITGNEFQGTPGEVSLYLADSRRTSHPDEGFPQLFDVKGNSFHTAEGGTAIQGLNNVDAKIWNNKFLGTGTFGVWLNGDEATNRFAENIKLNGNNFFKATYTDASVYLGPYTKDCKVVGVKTDQVVDEGVENTIIGTNAHKKGEHSVHGMHQGSFSQHGKFPHSKMK
jgi:hypothetical protein